jgi:hypothetical protein
LEQRIEVMKWPNRSPESNITDFNPIRKRWGQSANIPVIRISNNDDFGKWKQR